MVRTLSDVGPRHHHAVLIFSSARRHGLRRRGTEGGPIDGTVADRCACCDQVILLADDNGELDVLEYGYTCEECVAVIKEKVRAMSN